MRNRARFRLTTSRAADLQGRRATVKISRVEMRDVGDDTKPVVYFEGKDKGLVLNKTNSNTISTTYGDETDDWVGMEIVLFETIVEFQGHRKPRFRCPCCRGGRRAADEEINDTIPF